MNFLSFVMTHAGAGSYSQVVQEVKALDYYQFDEAPGDLINHYIEVESGVVPQEYLVAQKLDWFQFNVKHKDLIKNYVEAYDEISSDQDRTEFNIYVTTMLIEYVAKKRDLHALHNFFSSNDDLSALKTKIVSYLKDMEVSQIEPSILGVALIAEERKRDLVAKYEKKSLCIVL